MGPITIDVEVLRDTEEKEIKIPNCWVCMDQGFLIYNKKIDDKEYEYIAYCVCPAGIPYRYDGTKCAKHKSPYYVASIADVVDPEMMANENLNHFISKHKDNDAIMKALKDKKARLRGNDSIY